MPFNWEPLDPPPNPPDKLLNRDGVGAPAWSAFFGVNRPREGVVEEAVELEAAGLPVVLNNDGVGTDPKRGEAAGWLPRRPPLGLKPNPPDVVLLVLSVPTWPKKLFGVFWNKPAADAGGAAGGPGGMIGFANWNVGAGACVGTFPGLAVTKPDVGRTLLGGVGDGGAGEGDKPPKLPMVITCVDWNRGGLLGRTYLTLTVFLRKH